MIYIRIAEDGAAVTDRLPQSSILKISKKKTEKAKKETALGEAVRLSLFAAANIVGEKIEYGENGKPYLSCRPDIAYNISHSENLAVGVLMTEAEGFEVGCDVELIDRNSDRERRGRIAKRFYTEKERLAIESSEDETAEFYRIWTRKEAYIKYTGEGLSHPLSSFDVTEQLEGVFFETDILVAENGAEYAFSICIPTQKRDILFDTEFIK